MGRGAVSGLAATCADDGFGLADVAGRGQSPPYGGGYRDRKIGGCADFEFEVVGVFASLSMDGTSPSPDELGSQLILWAIETVGECAAGSGCALTVDTNAADASARLSRAAGARAAHASKAGITTPCPAFSGRARGGCLPGFVADAAGDEGGEGEGEEKHLHGYGLHVMEGNSTGVGT